MNYLHVIGGGSLFLFCLCYALNKGFSGRTLSPKEATKAAGAVLGAAAGWGLMVVPAVMDAWPEPVAPESDRCSVTITTPDGQEQRVEQNCPVTITLEKG